MARPLALAFPLVFVLAMGLPALPAAGASVQPAREVAFAPDLDLDTRFVYRLRTDRRYTVPPTGDAPARTDSYTLEAVLRFAVGGVDDRQRLAAVTCAVTEVTLRATVDGRTASAKRRDDDRDRPVEPPEPGHEAPKLRAMLDELAAALVARVMIMDVRADGTVVSLTGLELAGETAAGHGRSGRRALGPLTPELAPVTLGACLGLDTYDTTFPPDRGVGDTWTLERTRPVGPGLGVRADVERTLVAIDASVVSTRDEATLALVAPTGDPPAPGPAEPRFTLDPERSARTGSARWDLDRGRLLERRDETRLALSASIGDLERELVLESTRAIELGEGMDAEPVPDADAG